MITHDALVKAIGRKCEERRLAWRYIRDGRATGTPGFPDLVIAGPRGMVFREVKTPYDTTSAAQDYWGAMLLEPGRFVIAEVRLWAVWTPDDLVDGTVDAELDALK